MPVWLVASRDDVVRLLAGVGAKLVFSSRSSVTSLRARISASIFISISAVARASCTARWALVSEMPISLQIVPSLWFLKLG